MKSELRIRRFDMSTVNSDKVVVCIGRRGTGKSWAVRELLSHHCSIPTGVVVSPTEQANKFFGNMVPKVFIHDEYKPEIIDNVIKRQTSVMKKISSGLTADPRAFLILDDCNYDTTWLKDKNIRYLFMNGRHIKVFFVVTMQYSLGLPPVLRTNIDYAFIFRETNIANRRRIFDNYAGCIPSFEIFNKIMDMCTQNHEFLVIDNTCTSNELNEQVFYYKAEEAKPFRMCSEAMWSLSEQMEREGDSEDEDTPGVYDLEKMRKLGARLKLVKD